MDCTNENKLKLFKRAFGRKPKEGEIDRLFSSRFEIGFTSKEAKVMELRYGFGGDECLDLPEIGKRLGLTRKAVNALEARAIRKIRRTCLTPEDKAILPAERKGKWVLKQNGESLIFDTFEKGVEEFRKRIRTHLEQFPECYHDGLPFNVGAFFFAREEVDEITDAELVIRARLEKLFGLLLCEEPIRVNEYALRALDPKKKSVYYSESDLLSNDILTVSLKKRGDVIYAHLEYGEADDVQYLFTNAFAFEDPKESYYFESNQVVTTGEEDRLGLQAFIRISLERLK